MIRCGLQELLYQHNEEYGFGDAEPVRVRSEVCRQSHWIAMPGPAAADGLVTREYSAHVIDPRSQQRLQHYRYKNHPSWVCVGFRGAACIP